MARLLIAHWPTWHDLVAGAPALLGAALLASPAAVALGRTAPHLFAAASYALGLLAPFAVVALLLAPSPVLASVALAILLATPLAFATQRVPSGTWRTARALGLSPLLTITAVLLPPLAPTIGGSVLFGVAAVALRAAIRSAG